MLADAHRRTSLALQAGHLGSHQLGVTYSVTALLRSWPLDEQDLHRASALTAEVAATADSHGRGLMSVSLQPDQRSLRVTADEHDEVDGEDPTLTVDVTESGESRTTFVVARQRSVDDSRQPEPVVWFSLTVADHEDEVRTA